MANPHPTPNPRTATYPWLTCVNCRKTKRATQFPKRGGPTYEKLKATDPRRYDSQCKLCKKPVPSNAPSGYIHKEPKTLGMGAPKKKKRRNEASFCAMKHKRRTRIATRMKSMQYLSRKGCHKCGERDPRKLEYDHKNPADKHRSISRFITDGYSWASAILRAEIRKCRVLCANCHRVHTIKQQGYYASPEVQATLNDIARKFDFKV